MNGAQPKRSECFGHGTTQVIFEPLDFIARLAALIPRPRANLTRFHGVCAKKQVSCKSVMNLFFAFVERFRASLVGRRLTPTLMLRGSAVGGSRPSSMLSE